MRGYTITEVFKGVSFDQRACNKRESSQDECDCPVRGSGDDLLQNYYSGKFEIEGDLRAISRVTAAPGGPSSEGLKRANGKN